MNCAEGILLLAKAPTFSSLPEGDLKRLGELVRPKQYPPDEIVIRHGNFGDTLYFIRRGEVDVYIGRPRPTGWRALGAMIPMQPGHT